MQYLKNQLQQEIRQAIESTADCKHLIDAVYQETGEILGVNTIRRLFGLLEGRKPRLSTLNILARYLGYDSYEDFKLAQSRQDVLHTYASLIGSANTLSFDSFINGIQDYRHFILLARELLLTKRISDFLNILESDLCQQMLSNYDRQILMGNLCGSALAITPYSDEELKQLVQHHQFLTNVIYTHVDYGALNGYFGRINSIAIQQNVLNKPFHLCLDNFIRYLNRLPSMHDPFSIEVTANKHPILNSRIIATRLLYTYTSGNYQFIPIIHDYQDFLDNSESNCMEAWFEVKLMAVVMNETSLYEALYDKLFVSEMAEHFQWSHYQLHLLFKVYYYLHQKAFDFARNNLQSMDPESIYSPYLPLTNVLIKRAYDKLNLTMPDPDNKVYADYPVLNQPMALK